MRLLIICFVALTKFIGQPIEFEDPNLEQALLSSVWSLGSESLFVDSNDDGMITVQEATDVHGLLSLSSRSISSLDGMQHFANLRKLIVVNNQIETLLPLIELKNLKSLQADGNPITEIAGVLTLPRFEGQFKSKLRIS